MKPVKLKINGEVKEVEVPEDVPLLWVIREELGLTGTKYGCGKALCGACTVHLDGKAVRSCSVGVGDVGAREVTTIEGIYEEDNLHPVQQAWIEENVPQCGYCQIGQIMSAVAMLSKTPNPTDEQIDAVMSANLCRCGTYPRIKRAIKRAVELSAEQKGGK